MITDTGVLIRQPVDSIRTIGRVTQGVKLIRLDEGAKISSLSRVVHVESENTEEETTDQEEPAGEESVEA